jgi:hypothetical protein
MGGPSSDPISCANQSRKEKSQTEGYVSREAGKKEPFKSMYDSETCCAYFMVYGIIWAISMSAFVEDALALELPLSRRHVFPNPLIFLLSCPFIDLQVSLIRFQALTFIALELGRMQKG